MLVWELHSCMGAVAMSIFKKIGQGLKKVVKKVGKYAVPLAGIGGALLGAPKLGNAIGGLFSSKDSAQSYPVRSEGQPQVNEPSFMDQAGSFLKSAAPVIAGGLNYYGQSQTNAANAQQAQKQMDFQEQQTSTSYQRGMKDMEAAGLNPMLAYAQGGASSGSGAQAQIGNELGAGANSALSTAMTMQQLKGMELQNVQQMAEVQRTQADTDYLRAQRLDKLEGIPTHAVNRAGTEAGTKRTGSQFRNQEMLNDLLSESYGEQLKMYSSARRAKDAEGTLTAARIGEAEGRSRTVKGFGDWIGEGQDAINSAKGWLGENLGTWLPTPYDIKEYGRRK
ncbi:MAG: DNA pilot protein [Microviridae sp.]|nr:MAG: DNA pilot protein [Microviridae sp.]